MPEPPTVPVGGLVDDSIELVCVATSRDARLVGRWCAALERAAITSRVQTITARGPGRGLEAVYLHYVPVPDEERAITAVDARSQDPVFPLAHLRHTEPALSRASVADDVRMGQNSALADVDVDVRHDRAAVDQRRSRHDERHRRS